MNILWFLFGFMVASLVWAAVVVFLCEKDLKNFGEMMQIMREINDITDKQYAAINGRVQALCDISKDIASNNKAFNTEVLDLVEAWGKKICGRPL